MPMRRRPLLRAAAVGGGAYVAGRRVAQRSAAREQQENAQNERIANVEDQQAPAAESDAQAPSMPDQLDQLATLHQQGSLSDDEFTAAKARLLGS
jgi:hypothetical protein